MDSGGVDSPVTLIIKAPNQKYEDQTINCFLNWTVERLKSHISKVYPSRPLSRDQRLVYSGRLLQDHLQLGDVLRKQDEYHMMHLVCASHSPPASPVPRTPSSSSDSSTSDDSLSPENPPASSPIPGSSDGLRYRFPPYAQWPAAAQVPLNGGLPPHVPLHPAYMPLQMLWWQQMYARQYYLQYHAAVASAQPAAPPAPAPSPSPLPPAQPNEPVQPLGPAHNPLPEDQPANPIQMNAQGGPVLNDDELNRDWLDWLYTVSRASVLLSIVYFYSSFSRFVMVAGAMLLVYLYQAGWAIFRPEQQNFRGVDRAGAPQGEAERRQDLQEMERLMDDGMEDEDSAEEGGGGPEDPTAAAQPEPSLLTTAWSFISTFFTSLLPERPPHLAN
ncbi:Homocysteine-responsive endoplasmic reticulum-resident ubiquitin-like domain member 2 protein [Oryzias melastigma]|uniref:Homocysteine-responsive endoplasmic reticulum-resident ubiquitin-like domain member 2 protein n=1 Tax=Oryzias melastigma TaxID=30732 RepID=A0A3B3BFH1_ORYME|nr:homocysteine-responsive endoplasmic reticulum-resident ubiquitin-like domain member 2 protein isoform X1 [Oryzias melastigma]XP_024114316.1 homocysteine-responsive endoplasmic reticulum-resident ubiquitin-like domain member 2 protein isoform X1 [Oryzias melastigma]XP_024114317.1 homocysteine-responsive endoplasmic reticulum-resident ubiquitin-like domain member 2 protein isoform X1 [Oryzias melastigma]KAF6720660.1 Homocysteine-responsive endoplasmic reticulum-resident ubiquitin-like domain me